MRIDRKDFNDNFTTYDIPDWNCSTCHKGKLLFDKKNITEFETAESKLNQKHEAWEPSWLDKFFHGTLTCNNPKCKEIFSIAGEIKIEEDYDGEHGATYTNCYYQEYIYPTLHLFKIAEDTPSEIEESIKSAFKVFWIDKSACANSIRTTVEVILNDKRILKTELLAKKKKRRSLSLHERIELFEKKNKEVANYLMAIKWIGNAGSHDGEITNEDILDGFDLLKYSIEKLYTSHEKEMAQITKQINKKRKPLT